MPSRTLYSLLRIYFVFFPINLLIVRIMGFHYITYWKDITYILCLFIGVKYLSRYKFIIVYLLLVLLTLFFEFFVDNPYYEYLTWLIMGIPLILYINFIKLKDFDFDCVLIGIIILLSFLWVIFFESKGSYSDVFVGIDDGVTFLRDDELRMRFCFVSAMAYSQYCWFALLIFYFNKRINLKIRTIFILCSIACLIICNTRAGLLLSLLSISILFYTRFFYMKKLTKVAFVLLCSFLILFQMVQSSFMDSDVATADSIRLGLLTKGLEYINENFILGMGGIYFSPRSNAFLCFENSLLSLITCFGFIGICIFCWYMYLFIIKVNQKSVIVFSLPWIIYSVIFPTLQEGTAVFISWFILGLILNEKKSKILFAIE